MSTRTQITIGSLLWLLSVQYYAVQLIVAAAWKGNQAFSLANNTISDLGNTACAPYGDRFVCSPLHPVMNGSFLMLGISMIVGALLLAKALQVGLTARLGFYGMVAAGIGTILVGLFPENSIAAMHVLGAALPFVLGNLGMILVSVGIRSLPLWLRSIGVALGVVGLVALPMFVGGITLGIGSGGVERIVAYPQSIWMILLGAYWLLKRS